LLFRHINFITGTLFAHLIPNFSHTSLVTMSTFDHTKEQAGKKAEEAKGHAQGATGAAQD